MIGCLFLFCLSPVNIPKIRAYCCGYLEDKPWRSSFDNIELVKRFDQPRRNFFQLRRNFRFENFLSN